MAEQAGKPGSMFTRAHAQPSSTSNHYTFVVHDKSVLYYVSRPCGFAFLFLRALASIVPHRKCHRNLCIGAATSFRTCTGGAHNNESLAIVTGIVVTCCIFRCRLSSGKEPQMYVPKEESRMSIFVVYKPKTTSIIAFVRSSSAPAPFSFLAQRMKRLHAGHGCRGRECGIRPTAWDTNA